MVTLSGRSAGGLFFTFSCLDLKADFMGMFNLSNCTVICALSCMHLYVNKKLKQLQLRPNAAK